MKNKKILVVGGAGFVGSNLVHKLLEYDPNEIIVIDNLLSSEITNIPIHSKVSFIFGSINDKNILDLIPSDLDYAFNLACYHGNQSSIKNIFDDHENNTLTSLSLFNKLKDFKKLKKVVYAAAACAVAPKTYDSPRPTLEDEPINMFHDSPYSISKIIGEFYGNYFFKSFKLPFVKARFSNVYGPREILGAGKWRGTEHTVWRNVIPSFIWKIIHNHDIRLDNNGDTSRDFIFVEDMVEGLILCATNGEPGEAYNLATGNETKIIDLAQFIVDFTNSNSKMILAPARAWDSSGKRFASTLKAQKDLGFVSRFNISDGLEITINWTKANMKLIEENIYKHNIFLNKTNEDFK